MAALTAALVSVSRAPSAQTPPSNAYTVLGLDTRKLLPVRTVGTAELVPLDQVAAMFSVTTLEDRLTGSLTITAKGQRVVLTPGQSLVSVGDRLVSLSGPVLHDRSGWFVPVDLLSRVLGPALNVRIDVHRSLQLIAVGAARVATVTTRIDRVPNGGRVSVDADSTIGRRLTRDGNKITIQFDAVAIDAPAAVGSAPDYVAGTHVDGNALVIDLGPSAAVVHSNSDSGHLTIDLEAGQAPPPPPSAPARPPTQATVAPDLEQPSGVRTIVVDPGHGGDDGGVRGPHGSLEKDVVLQLAHRLKAAVESQLGIRVVLTREGDESVPVDRRTALANSTRADLLISLHANASLRVGAHGAEVFSLGLDQYKSRATEIGPGDHVPVVGGGTRLIQTVPWELAQLPYVDRSAEFAAVTVRHLSAQNVPLFARASITAPLVGLAGINMPAILLEAGFLTNPDDERALASGGDLVGSLVAAIVDTLSEIRSTGLTRPPPSQNHP